MKLECCELATGRELKWDGYRGKGFRSAWERGRADAHTGMKYEHRRDRDEVPLYRNAYSKGFARGVTEWELAKERCDL